MENCTVWKSGTARKSSLDLVLIQATAKEEGRLNLTENVSAVNALVASEQIAEPKLTSMEDPQNLRPKGKVLEIVKIKRPLIFLIFFEVLSDHGDEMDGDCT